MPFPGLGLLAGAARGLASKGLIRGTAGRMLGGGGGIPRLTGGFAGGASAVGKVLRRGASSGVGQVVIGSAIVGGVQRFRKDGKPYKRRTMSATNPQALKRAIRRLEKFEKMVKRSFIVKDIKPRRTKSCR